jgi:hypothetical protein
MIWVKVIYNHHFIYTHSHTRLLYAGGTVFLPNTNNLKCHQEHKSTIGNEKILFLNSCKYKQALLKKGDMQIMDSRTLHFGDANIGGRLCHISLIHSFIHSLIHSL